MRPLRLRCRPPMEVRQVKASLQPGQGDYLPPSPPPPLLQGTLPAALRSTTAIGHVKYFRANHEVQENTAHLTWNNGIGTNIKHIKAGLDGGTCGYFKDVQCYKKK